MLHLIATSLLIAIAIDGDTLELCTPDRAICERVRIANLETPELYRPQCPVERYAAERARAYAQALLDDARDIAIVAREGRSHGRTVARVSVDGEDFGALMMRAGHGLPYRPAQHVSWCGAPIPSQE